MKKIRLEVPLGEGLDTTAYKYRRLFLKVGGSKTMTTAFYDKDCKKPILEEGPKVNLDIEMPDEIGLIAVAASCDGEVSEEIAAAWLALFHVINRFEGLKKIHIIAENGIHEVKVCKEKPSVEDWLANRKNDWWHTMSWGLVVYVYESESFGILRWSSGLAKKAR